MKDSSEKSLRGNKIMYHGSAAALAAGGFLQPRKAFDSDLQREIVAVFGTPDFEYAKMFAIHSLIMGPGLTWIKNGKFYCSSIKPMAQIGKSFFIYELDGCGFRHDARNEWFFEGEKEILQAHEFDIRAEIKKMGIEIYVLDEFDEMADRDRTSAERMTIFDGMMKQDKYHKVEIA